MENPKINFLKIKETNTKKTFWARVMKFFVYLIAVLAIAIFIFARQVNFSDENLNDNFSGLKFLYSLTRLTQSSDKPLIGEGDNRINILLLGIGGGEHEGSTLTDTIILASIEPSTKKIALLSIPRDLVVPIPGYGSRKVNSANAFGEVNKPGSGADLTMEILSKVLNIDIPYYVRVDFNAFKKIIDDIGGIKIDVDNSFTDPLYPDQKFSYEPVSFEKGWQVMDGDRALKFVRSRHALGEEGSDFARSRRQQKVLLALKEKMSSLDFLLNPKNITNILGTLEEHVGTNLEIWEMIHLAKIAKDADNLKIINQVLEAEPNGPLVSSITNGAFILQPRTGNWNEIQDIAQNILKQDAVQTLKEKSREEAAIIEIQNGTKQEGLAYNTSLMLEKLGYQTVKIGNAANQDYEKTVIYDLTRGKKPNSLGILKEKLQANVSLSIPGWLSSTLSPEEVTLTDPNSVNKSKSADFLIILGTYNTTNTNTNLIAQ
jgi:LCP family protein required for cell wall assembly